MVAAQKKEAINHHFYDSTAGPGNKTKSKYLLITGCTIYLFLLPQYFNMILQNLVFVGLIMGVFIAVL